MTGVIQLFCPISSGICTSLLNVSLTREEKKSVFNDAGRQSDSSDVHSLNDPSPIVPRFETDSKINEHRREQQ
jgi:hypothetical protein